MLIVASTIPWHNSPDSNDNNNAGYNSVTRNNTMIVEWYDGYIPLILIFYE